MYKNCDRTEYSDFNHKKIETIELDNFMENEYLFYFIVNFDILSK